MVSLKLVGARIGAHLDRLTELYEQSEKMPLTLEGFVRDLVSGRCASEVSPSGLIDAGIAMGVIRGIVIATGIDLVQLVEAMLGSKGATQAATDGATRSAVTNIGTGS